MTDKETASEHLRNALQGLQSEIKLTTDTEMLVTLTSARDRVQAALDLVEEVRDRAPSAGATGLYGLLTLIRSSL